MIHGMPFYEVIVCYADRGHQATAHCVNGREIRLIESYYFEIGAGETTK